MWIRHSSSPTDRANFLFLMPDSAQDQAPHDTVTSLRGPLVWNSSFGVPFPWLDNSADHRLAILQTVPGSGSASRVADNIFG